MISAFDARERPNSRPGRHNPAKEPGTHYTEGRVEPQIGLRCSWRTEKSLASARIRTSDRSAPSV